MREAEIDEQGNVKLLETLFLEGKSVTHLHNLNEKQLIAFVHGDKDFYIIDKESGYLTPIVNPSGKTFYISI